MTVGTLRTAADLVRAGLVAPEQAGAIARVTALYSAAISPALAALIDPADPHDPIARQFVPDPHELLADGAERADPIGDGAHSPVPGIVHRYRDRALLKIVSTCPVYCRFCFRRETVGDGKSGLLPEADLDAALGYVAAHPEIWEVILTGGDPLILSPRRLRDVLTRLDAIAHVGTVRVHTRVPVVTPDRVNGELLSVLRSRRAPVRVAVHANHTRELSGAARAAIGRLADAGIPLLSQSVLLAGVNDDVETLVALMRAFVESRVTPYYLHHPDLAPGTRHFRLPIARGRALVAALGNRLPGFARPRYVLDLPGGFGKVSLENGTATETAPGRWAIRDRAGGVHLYFDACNRDERGGPEKAGLTVEGSGLSSSEGPNCRPA